jgi:hypothetical protein
MTHSAVETSDPVSPALDRLRPDINLLHGGVCGLELIVRRAEELDDEGVRRALPFLGLIWLYATAMRDLLHTKRQDGSMLWNAPALAALCRPLQEAFLSLVYFAIENPLAEEGEFRQLLLARHTVYKRWDLLRRADQGNETVARECGSALADWDSINQAVLGHPFMAKLAPKVAKDIAKDGDKYILDPLDAVWERAGMSRELYDVIFRYLSQYAHATPYALSSLQYHQADNENGAVNMTIPVGLALACVTKALEYAGNLHPELEALLPRAFHEFMGA